MARLPGSKNNVPAKTGEARHVCVRCGRKRYESKMIIVKIPYTFGRQILIDNRRFMCDECKSNLPVVKISR